MAEEALSKYREAVLAATRRTPASHWPSVACAGC
jgi:hypothetical protein